MKRDTSAAASLDVEVRAAQAGDGDAYGRIVARFQDMAFAVALARLRNPAVAEEAAQEAFIEALMSLGRLGAPAAFTSWFRTILERQCSRALRGRKPSAPIGDVDDPVSWEDGPERRAEVSEFRQALMSMLDEMPDHERIVIVMHYVADYSQAQVGEFLELPMTTVKKRLHDAKRRLRASLTARARREIGGMAPSRDGRLRQTVELAGACIEGDTTRAVELVRADPKLVGGYGHVAESHMRRIDAHWGWTPLHLAGHYGHLDIVRLLVESGADIEARALNAVGNTPLGAAVWGHRPDVVAYLISRGADLEAKNRFGQSPLHRAIRRGAVEVARILIDAGADPASEDGEGVTALAIAERQANPPMIGALVRKDIA